METVPARGTGPQKSERPPPRPQVSVIPCSCLIRSVFWGDTLFWRSCNDRQKTLSIPNLLPKRWMFQTRILGSDRTLLPPPRSQQQQTIRKNLFHDPAFLDGVAIRVPAACRSNVLGSRSRAATGLGHVKDGTVARLKLLLLHWDEIYSDDRVTTIIAHLLNCFLSFLWSDVVCFCNMLCRTAKFCGSGLHGV